MNPAAPIPYSILPTEISLQILLKIDDLDSLAQMCQTSKQVQQICASDYFWELKYRQDYGVVPKNYQTWRVRYREKYEENWEINTPISCKHGTIARIARGKLYMLGKGNTGQLGDGTRNDSKIPIHIPFKKPVISISCGKGFTGAITRDGLLYMWGRNDFYQLGLGISGRVVKSPRNVKVGGAAKKISCGQDCAAMMTKDNSGYIWGAIKVHGRAYEYGRYKRPTLLLSYVTDIAAGSRKVLLINSNSQVYQTDPKPGISKIMGDLSDHTPLYLIPTSKPIKSIQVSHPSLCALATDGSVYQSWDDDRFRLNFSNEKPITISDNKSLPPISKISSSPAIFRLSRTTIVITKGGRLFIWGKNGRKIPSLPYFIDKPTEIEIGHRPKYVSVSEDLVCVVTDDGYLNIW